MTEGDQWFDVPHTLFKDNIAKPVIWLGDDRHYNRARKVFGDDVVQMNTFVHRPYELNNINYKGEFSEFFNSENYFRYKDICLKMMDRLDLYGFFSRIDREVYFNKLTIWALKKIFYSKPEFLIAAEAPHDHAKYIIYEIFQFLGIPVFKFNCWTPAPLLFLQEMPSNRFVEKKFNSNSDLDQKMDNYITEYFNNILNSANDFEHVYMKNQRLNSRLDSKILNFFKKDLKSYFLAIKRNVGIVVRKKYNPINPYRYGFILRMYNQFYRKHNLRKNLYRYSKSINLNDKYVYFPLHFEPERTTNPDGGEYHDQFKALVKLRKFVPEHIKIIVKEHPSQIYVALKGSRGRSPMFYELINNLKGVELIDLNFNSQELIKNSEMVATITGTVALESAIIGKKSITFGSVWYDRTPNIFLFSDVNSYEEINNKPIVKPKYILKHLLEQKNKYTIIAFQNGSKLRKFEFLKNKQFNTIQNSGIKSFIISIINNNLNNNKL